MKNPLIIRRASIDRFFQLPRIHADNFLMIEKRTLARWIFYVGILIAFFGALDPWFLWGIYRYYVLFSFLPIATSMLLFRGIEKPLFNRKDYLYPFVFCTLVLLIMALTAGKNINGIFMVAFSATIYLSLFRIDKQELIRLGDFLSTVMAGMMLVSIPCYFAHKLGVPLPHHHTAPEGLLYTFENYYFFLIDDRFAFDLLPRFHSVFLEPSHLGMACIALLYCQIGKWNTWRCKVLFFTLVITFSLAAYICLVLLIFSAAWMKGKAVVGKLILLGVLGGTLIIGSMFYNKGQNLVNLLIVQRITGNGSDAGEMENDNRTTDLFTKEYEKVANSNQIWFGKGIEDLSKFGFGNAGYRVFIYSYGIVSIAFLIVFFWSFLRTSDNQRAKMSCLLINFASFIPHAIPMKFYLFIPLYILAFNETRPPTPLSKKEIKDGGN